MDRTGDIDGPALGHLVQSIEVDGGALSIAGMSATALSALLLSLYGFSSRGRAMTDCCHHLAAALDCDWAALVRLVGDGSRDQVLGLSAPRGAPAVAEADVLSGLRGCESIGDRVDGLPVDAPVLFLPAAGQGGGRPHCVALLAHKEGCRYLLCLGPTRLVDGDAGLVRDMRLLLPHLRQALALRDAIDEHRARVLVDACVLDRAPTGFIVLAPDGAVDFVNEPARALLSSADGIMLAGPVLAAEDPRLQDALAESLGDLRRCNGEAELESRDLLATRPSGAPPYLVTLLPVVIGGNDTILMTRRRLLVVITDPAGGRLPSRNYLQQVFGLSPAEARVCQQMGGAQDIEEVARFLNLSVATVKSHLLRIYQKFDVSSRAQLVQRLQGHFWASRPIVVRLDRGEATSEPRSGDAPD